MSLPTRPPAWANKISGLLQQIQEFTGEVMYPVQIQEIAVEVSKQFFPDSPITRISGEDFSGSFEGALTKVPHTEDEWGIAYNTAITSPGRINFTLAHEFGHYLLHRIELQEGIRCKREDMFVWDSEHGKREAEANEFASYLLMPINLFNAEIENEELTLHLFKHVADHFNVSLTAAILKWLSFTTKRAMLLVGKDGFVDWVWSSELLRKSGVFLQPKKDLIEIPLSSLAHKTDIEIDSLVGVKHKPKIWPFDEEVHEMTVHADTYDMTITLLVFPDSKNSGHDYEAEPEAFDAYDNFMSFDKRMNQK